MTVKELPRQKESNTIGVENNKISFLRKGRLWAF
jgi:hypothetical protein